MVGSESGRLRNLNSNAGYLKRFRRTSSSRLLLAVKEDGRVASSNESRDLVG